VASTSRLLKMIGLLCRIWSCLYGIFAKETYNFNKPTNRSHIIVYFTGRMDRLRKGHMMYICMYEYIYLYIHIYICIFINMCISIYICMCGDIYIYI